MIAVLLITINIAGPLLTLRLKNAYDAEVVARSHARQAQIEALDSLDLAEKRERDLNNTLYRAEMHLAGQAAAERAGIERVWDLTDAWRPDKKGVDLRDWEWYYLHGLGRLAQQTFPVDGGHAEAIAWSPDGSLIAFGQDDGTMVVWHPRTAKTILRKNLHKAHVLHVCWSPDGTKLASIASQDKYVRVWDAFTGNEFQSFPLPGENDWSGSVSFSHDNRRLAADSRNEIAVWDLQSGHHLRTLKMAEVSQVAWSPVDNRIAALSKQHRIMVWDGSTGEQLATYEQGSGCFTWAPRGKHLAYAGQDRRVHILDLSTGQTVNSSVGHVAAISTLAWNTDGTRLASAGKDTTVRIWDPKTGDEIARLRGHAGFVTSLAWMPDRPLLATSARDLTLKIWNTDSTEERLLLEGHRAPVKSLSWGPSGRYLAMSSGTWTALWDVDDRSELREQLGQRSALSPNGQQLAIASGANIEIRDTKSGESIATLDGHTEGITRLAWNAEGSRLASASWDGTARIWNPATEESLITIELSHRDRGICWSPDGLRLATIGNHDVQIWDAQNGTRQLQITGHDQIHAIAWSPDGQRIASGGWGHGITVWDADTAESVFELAGHTSPITSLCWNPTGTRLASGSEDQLVRVWDVASRGELLSLRAHLVGVTSVAWSPDGTRIASGDQNGQVVIWDASNGHIQERTPRAIAILNRRIEANPKIEDIALRGEILQDMGETEAASKDRQRVRQIREEQLDELLADQLAIDALANELLAEIQIQKAARWSMLSPLRMKANDGATLALQPDRSILVTGPNTAGVEYEIVAVVKTPVTGLRLEAIPDSRLPYGGSGRATDNGNFHVAEIEVFELKSDSVESDAGREIAITQYCEDSQNNPVGRSIAKVIDDNRRTLWDTYPNHTKPHWAIFQFAQPLIAKTGSAVIRIRLDSGISPWGPHGLGRFRLSVTGDAEVAESEQLLMTLVSGRSHDIAFLGGAYAILGEMDKAASALSAAILQSQNQLERRSAVATAARFDGLVSRLSSRLPGDPWLMLAEADQCADCGELERSIHLRGKAITRLLDQCATAPEDLLQALEEVAVAYLDNGRVDESLQVLRPAYEVSREALTRVHPQTINLLGRLADVSEQVGEFGQVRELRLEEFTLREQMHGLEDHQTLTAGRKLAVSYAKCGQISEAIALRVRIAEAAPVEDLNASQQTAFFLIWQGNPDRYASFCRRLLEAAKGTAVIKVARDSSKAVLIRSQVDAELVEAATVLANQAAERSRKNLWSVLTLGLSHYRQGRLAEANECLHRAAKASETRLSLLARVFLAMTKFRQGEVQEALEQFEKAEEGLGPVAVIDLQSPFFLHHDDLAIWLALRGSAAVDDCTGRRRKRP